jgi:hypothetical protein
MRERFFKSIVHIQSNNKTGLIGRHHMAQAGLEKLYYWIFKAEKKHPNETPTKITDINKYLNIGEQQALLRFNNLKGFYKTLKTGTQRYAGAITTIRMILYTLKNTFKIDLETKKRSSTNQHLVNEMTL